MTRQPVALNGGWTGFQRVTGDDAAATTDLIDILDAVDVPIVVVRRDFVIACFNKVAADVLRLSPSDIGRAPRDIPVLTGLPRLEEQCSQVIARAVESRVDLHDGDKWFVVRIAPCTRGDRQVTGTVLTFTNVTAFRASVDQAIYEREYTKAILNTVGDPLVVLSADQRIQSGNRAFYAMFRVSRDETQGVPLRLLANGAFALAALRTQLDEMLAGSDAFEPVEVDHASPETGPRTLMLDARPVSLPGHAERRVLVTFRDITARKQAEAAERKRVQEKLRRSEALLAEAQRLSSTGTFSWQVATDEITWSEQTYRIFECDPAEPVTLQLIGTRLHPEDIPAFEEMLLRQEREGTDFEHEHRLRMPDQSVKYLHVVARATRDQEDHLKYIGWVQDVTERRLSEAALAKAQSELAHVARVTSLGALTASIAHEVNQPLSGIITNASTCLRMLATDPPNIGGALETARRTIRDGRRASDVIARLRALFSKQDTATESVDLNEAAREVIALSVSELQRGRVILRPEFAKDLPPVTGDRVQLQQVILNLLRNAADAMSGVDDRPRQLVIRTEGDEGDRVRLTVQDTGVGFEPQGLDKLFEAFYTTKSGGMGIGLSVSRSIIESHQGRIWAAPNDGPGATFAFSIPRAPEGPQAGQAAAAGRTSGLEATEHAGRTS
jgi:signal transduction histidine kinase